MSNNHYSKTNLVMKRFQTTRKELLEKISLEKSPKLCKKIITPKSVNQNFALNIKFEIENKIFIPGKVIKSKSPKSYRLNSSRVQKKDLKSSRSSKDTSLSPQRTSRARSSRERIDYCSPVFKRERKNLIDSFQSYYDSEKENLEILGHCEFSYVDFKLNHREIKRKRMIMKRKELRLQNDFIRKRIKDFVFG